MSNVSALPLDELKNHPAKDIIAEIAENSRLMLEQVMVNPHALRV